MARLYKISQATIIVSGCLAFFLESYKPDNLSGLTYSKNARLSVSASPGVIIFFWSGFFNHYLTTVEFSLVK